MAESEALADHDAVVRVFRDASSQVIATLARHFGDLDVSEEAVQDAFSGG